MYDVVIIHELTVKFQNDGSVHYVGNRILDNGIDNIPKYQYRLDKLQDDQQRRKVEENGRTDNKDL